MALSKARVVAEAGKFRVFDDGSFEGPEDYVKQVNVDKIANDVALFAMFSSAPTYQLIAVALQTDYAGWKGAKSLIDKLC